MTEGTPLFWSNLIANMNSPQAHPHTFIQCPLPCASAPLVTWLDAHELQPESFSHLLLTGSQDSSLWGHIGSNWSNGENQEIMQVWNNNFTVSSPRSCVTNFCSNDPMCFSSPNMEDGNRTSDFSHEYQNTEGTTTSKKAKVHVSSSSKSNSKVSKEKLGDRVTALHQLVSPFGKTDTASVLLEAYGYIKLLHSQIQSLICPYLEEAESNTSSSTLGEGKGSERDLSSRGLCLVPIPCTMNMEMGNYSEHWPPMALRRPFG